jgi:hypothetical protein
MSDTNICNCGDPVRYSHIVNGQTVGSCNKYIVCPTYEELLKQRDWNQKRAMIYEKCLCDISRINAMDYEYCTWAKQALELANG